MATGASQTAKLQVEVEARTDAAVASFDRLQSSTKKSREEVEKVDKAATRAASALRPMTAATEKQTAASTKASTAALAFGKAVDTAKGGAVGIGKAALAATAAFGPWGIAVGVVGSAIWGLAESEIEATKRTDELRKALEAQQRVLNNQRAFDLAEAEEDGKRGDARRARVLAEMQDDTARLATRRQISGAIMELEKQEAKGGRGAESARREMAELRALNAESLKDFETAKEIRHQEELRVIAIKNQGKAKKEVVVQDGAYLTALADIRMSQSVIERDDSRDFASAANSRPLMKRERTDPTVAAEASTSASLRALEVQRATTGETIDLINQEESARLRLLRVQHDAATTGEERNAIAADMSQVRHEAELDRIAQRKAVEEEAAEASMRAATMIADSAAGIAQAYLTSGDLSARGFRKAVGQFASAEAIRLTIVAIRESILGGVAASNPFTAALAPGHFAAAGQAAAGAATLGALALGLGAAGGGFGGMTKNVAGLSGSAFGPGTVAANDRPSVSNSQKDRVPVSSSEDSMRRSNSAAAGSPSSGGGQVIHIGSIHVLGAIDDTSARRIAQGIKSASGRDGRLTG
jgi:hypothetical protein